MIEAVVPWILSAIGVTGAVLNACRRRSSFALWSLANVGWIMMFAHRGMVPEALLFGVYLATSLFGFHKWAAPSV